MVVKSGGEFALVCIAGDLDMFRREPMLVQARRPVDGSANWQKQLALRFALGTMMVPVVACLHTSCAEEISGSVFARFARFIPTLT
jgi:hypothetical protein